MKAFEGYTYLDGGICAAKGFQASGTYCGIKKAMAPDSNEGEIGKEKNDIALVVADTLCNTAAVYTQNKVKGAPILVMKKHLAATGGKARALIANSKNANTCNADGEEGRSNVQADRRCTGHCTGRSNGYVHRCHRADFTVRAD